MHTKWMYGFPCIIFLFLTVLISIRNRNAKLQSDLNGRFYPKCRKVSPKIKMENDMCSFLTYYIHYTPIITGK